MWQLTKRKYCSGPVSSKQKYATSAKRGETMEQSELKARICSRYQARENGHNTVDQSELKAKIRNWCQAWANNWALLLLLLLLFWTSQRPQQTQNLLYVYMHCFIRKYWIPTSVIGGVSHHKHHNEAVFNWVSKLIHFCFTFASKPMAVFTLRTYTSRRMVHLVRLC